MLQCSMSVWQCIVSQIKLALLAAAQHWQPSILVSAKCAQQVTAVTCRADSLQPVPQCSHSCSLLCSCSWHVFKCMMYRVLVLVVMHTCSVALLTAAFRCLTSLEPPKRLCEMSWVDSAAGYHGWPAGMTVVATIIALVVALFNKYVGCVGGKQKGVSCWTSTVCECSVVASGIWVPSNFSEGYKPAHQ